MDDLFQAASRRAAKDEAPLAERMRPTTLDEVVGQQHLVAPGRLFRRLLEADRVPSMVLWGPPGTGKTTLAQAVASYTKAHFASISAVLSGVADLRKTLAEAERRRDHHRERTVLFVDEIHRWSKSQQDALLPAVERGLVTLIGATTENPSFELNSALLSRARVFVLETMSEADARALVERALRDTERGLGRDKCTIDEDALELLVAGANGDARRLLTTLEVAANDAKLVGEGPDAGRITRERLEEAASHRTLLYDKAGHEHYGVISAFIKSMRGSDPDAAVYYLVRMLEAGEDPRFLCRRIVIFAAEDVGLADPQALPLAVAAQQAFELVGLPEGVLPLTEAVSYLALAPKSNSALTTYAAARKAVRERGPLPVPKKLLPSADRLSKQLGHGSGYRYPHDFGGVTPGETHLPEALVGQTLYTPASDEERDRLQAYLDRVKPR